MNFDRFQKSLFYNAGRTRLHPVTLERIIPNNLTACVFDCTLPFGMTDKDTLNLHFKPGDFIQFLYLSFDQAIRNTIPKYEINSEWIPVEFENVLLSQRKEVTELVGKIITENNNLLVDRHRLVITPPGFSVFSHYHHISGSTITVGYVLDPDESRKSFLLMKEEQIPVEIPHTEKFMFHLKGDPKHGAICNHWICWHYTDFEKQISSLNTHITEIKSEHFIQKR